MFRSTPLLCCDASVRRRLGPLELVKYRTKEALDTAETSAGKPGINTGDFDLRRSGAPCCGVLRMDFNHSAIRAQAANYSLYGLTGILFSLRAYLTLGRL